MDDIDRLAFRLVRTAREKHPQLLSHGFSLNDVEERLLPYRETRREMADNGADAWEIAVLRLLSGEREYLSAEPGLQAACKQALQHPSPSISLIRGWATSTLMLGQRALQMGGRDITLANSSTAGSSAAAQAASAVGANSATATSAGTMTGTPKVGQSPVEQAGGSVSNAPRERLLLRRGCRYCGCKLPESRTVTFCPHCGMDLTKRQCPACSTELEMGWRFCVTCGRGHDELAPEPLLKQQIS